MRKIFSFIIITVSIPLMVINFFYSYSNKNKTISGFVINKYEDNKQNIRILKSDNKIDTIDLEEYLVGVVSSEVPVYFEDEAIKAQAVASRTYALKQIESNKNNGYDVTDNTNTQVYSSNEQLKEKWGNKYDDYYNKIKNLIDETKGEYISYNDDYIYAFFFSTSNGYTEDNKNVFGQDLPYLKMVDSSFDEEETDGFYKTVSFSKQEFYAKLNIPYSDSLVISEINKSESGRINSLLVNGNYFKGRDFQKCLSLRSNDFSIEENTDSIVITTKGYGHGVGMSQYGANALAKRNKNYIDILKYYYKDTEIKKL